MPAYQLKSDPATMADSKPTTMARNSMTTGNMGMAGVRRKTLRGWGMA